ncbi:MAG: ABC transporter permease, partial [Lactococcus raffinolactis]|nr:ABC transporter permease [Lactococcus raffinolactis]
MTKKNKLTAIPYVLWLFLFVLAPIALLVYKSFFDIDGNATLA